MRRKIELTPKGDIGAPVSAAEIRKWRKDNGYTQRNAADFFGVTVRTIENWEQGVSSTNVPVAIRALMKRAKPKRKELD